MKKLFTLCAICLIAGSLVAQHANFRAAEKYSASNLRPTTGDLSLNFSGNNANAGWVGDFDIFW